MYDYREAFNPQPFNFYVIQNLDSTIQAGDFICKDSQYLFPENSQSSLGISVEFLQNIVGSDCKVKKITQRNNVVFEHPMICPISKLQHSGNNQYMKADKDGNVHLYCLSLKCQGMSPLFICQNNDMKKKERKNVSFDINFDIQMNSKYLNFIWSDEMYKNKCVCIQSNLGTGKTHMIQNLIRNEFLNKNVLYISYRKSQTQDLQNRIEEFELYSNIEGNISFNKIGAPRKIICQLESLE